MSEPAELLRLMETATGIDPTAVAPSLESLLTGTEFANASILAALEPPGPPADG